MPLRLVPGYAGGRQQRCICCDKKTSFVCACCSTSPFALVPLCPEVTKAKKDQGKVKKGQIIKHACLSRHVENPMLRPGSKGARKAKRARSGATDGTESVHESGDEGDEGEEGED